MMSSSRSLQTLKAPFPYFGGKSRAAAEVWRRFGEPQNYIEPFFGSGACLLGRPTLPGGGIETVNDLNGFLANFWRALKSDPDEVAYHADNPVNEVDLHARHVWLLSKRDGLTDDLMGNPEYYDAKVAGWWVWGISSWIGVGWCDGRGPWGSVGGKFVHLGNAGRGVNRQSVHLGNAGMGVNRKFVHLGNAGMGLQDYLRTIADRIRFVRVNCGSYERVLGDSALKANRGSIAVFLDPPYAEPNTVDYGITENVAAEVRSWAFEHGARDNMKIALCTYSDEAPPQGWSVHKWKAKGGYGVQGDGEGRENSERETILFSPGCARPETGVQLTLID